MLHIFSLTGVFLHWGGRFQHNPQCLLHSEFCTQELTEKVQNPSSAVRLFKDLRHASSVPLLWKHIWKTESCWQRYTQKDESYNTELSSLRIQPRGIRTRLCSSFMPAKSTPWGTSSYFLWKMCSANKAAEEAGWMSLRGIWKYQGQFI